MKLDILSHFIAVNLSENLIISFGRNVSRDLLSSSNPNLVDLFGYYGCN